MNKRWATATALALIVSGLAACTGSSDDRPKVEILSPTAGTAIEGTSMTVKVRTRGENLTVLVDGRSVTDRLTGSGDEKTARLTLGRDFTLGRGTIVVAAGPKLGDERTVQTVGFVARKRDDSLLSHSATTRHGRVTLAVRSQQPIETATVKVNNKRVHRDRVNVSGSKVTANLAATDGVRHGSNTITADVTHADGTRSHRKTTVQVDENAPIAGAGKPQRGVVDQTVVLNGSAKASAKGGDVSAHWTIVASPPGSKATIANADSPKATLRPDKPGNYRLRLEAKGPDGTENGIDETTLPVEPSDDPMGVPIQTISTVGEIIAGTTTSGGKGNWIHMLVIDRKTGLPTPKGDRGFNTNDGGKLKSAIKGAGTGNTVILSGQGESVGSKLDKGSLADAFQLIGGTLDTYGPTSHGAADLADGNWSIVGKLGLAPGQAAQNLAVRQAGVPVIRKGSPGKNGSINGYLQRVVNAGYTYVSPEFTTVDTSASGSTATRNVIELGGKSYASSSIPAGAWAVQLLAVSPSDGMTPVAQGTYVIGGSSGALRDKLFALNGRYTFQGPCPPIIQDKCPKQGYSQHGVSTPPLVILQSFGKIPGKAVGDDNWVNDYIPPTSLGNPLHAKQQWDGSAFPYKPSSALSSSIKMFDGNQPTVAGEIGKLAGVQWHDVAANLGLPGRTGIAVVSSAQLARRGDGVAIAGTKDTPARIVATLTRNQQSQWTARTPSTAGGFGSGTLKSSKPGSVCKNPDWTALIPKTSGSTSFGTDLVYRFAFQAPTAWPTYDKQAMTYIAQQLLDDPSINDVRQAYRDKQSWIKNSANFRQDLRDLDYPSDQNPSFTSDAFDSLKAELDCEFEAVGFVWGGIESWQNLLGTSDGLAAYVALNGIAGKIVTEINDSAAEAAKEDAEVDPFDVSSASLLIAEELADIAGPESFGVAPAVMGAVAAGLDLGNALNPPEPKIVKDNSQVIRDKATSLGGDLVTQGRHSSDALDHVGLLFVSDLGKLVATGSMFRSQWQYDPKQGDQVVRSLSISAKRGFYEALLPLAFEQWVIAPKGDDDNPNGPVPPGAYQCTYYNGDGDEDGAVKPFSKSPQSSLDTIRWQAHGNPGQSDSTGRGLKIDSGGDRLTLHGPPYGIRHSGKAPDASLTDDLFKAPDVDDGPSTLPNNLGMNKDEFFGLPAWSKRRMICEQDQPIRPSD